MKNIQSKLLRRAKFIGKIISSFPYVQSVVLTGSLAQGCANKDSDIDIMIIAKAGRIFSARFFINAFGTIFCIKRSKDESKHHDGKFCFNYFVSDNYLMLPTGRGEKIDRYCADDYSRSKFIAGDRPLHKKFLEKNRKLFENYNCHPEQSSLSSPHHILSSPRRRGSTNSRFRIESGMTVNGSTSTRFERWSKNYQIKKIESDPITKQYPNLIVYNDNELRFHPPPLKLRRASPPK